MRQLSKVPNMAAHLTALPNEILHTIFQYLLPQDLATLPRVCRVLYNFVQGNSKLHHDLYLHTLDKPPDDEMLDWERELHDLVRLQNICRRQSAADKIHELDFVYELVNRLLSRASSAGYPIENSDTQYASKNAEILHELFHEQSTIVAFLQQSSLFERVYKSQGRRFLPGELTTEAHNKSAKLHCLYGRAIMNIARLRSTSTYPYACSKVYDLRNYSTLTKWGPFANDGTDRVDWEKVEAILVVLTNNIYTKRLFRLFGDLWEVPFSGAWSKSFIAVPKPDPSPLEARDPYGITGTWYRIVCFLDYNDFFSFNFPPHDEVQADAPRPPINYGEATRLIIMRIHVTEVEEPGPDYHQDYPVVHFRGYSRPLDDAWDDNSSSDIRGTVGMTKEREVRWTSYSIFHGQERWKSEGVQVGGIGSARGVVGNWFDRDYDPHGPCGPTAFWKASDAEDALHLNRSNRAVIPSDFLLWGTLIEMAEMDDSDPEGDMEYTNEDENENEDEDVELDDNESGSELVESELPGLLQDAGLEVIDLTTHQVEQE